GRAPGRDAGGTAGSALRGTGGAHRPGAPWPRRAAGDPDGRRPYPGRLARVVPAAHRGGGAAGVAGAVAGFQVRPYPGVAPVRPAGRDRRAAVSDLVVGADGRARCRWAGSAPDYLAYHDEEWG